MIRSTLQIVGVNFASFRVRERAREPGMTSPAAYFRLFVLVSKLRFMIVLPRFLLLIAR